MLWRTSTSVGCPKLYGLPCHTCMPFWSVTVTRLSFLNVCAYCRTYNSPSRSSPRKAQTFIPTSDFSRQRLTRTSTLHSFYSEPINLCMKLVGQQHQNSGVSQCFALFAKLCFILFISLPYNSIFQFFGIFVYYGIARRSPLLFFCTLFVMLAQYLSW